MAQESNHDHLNGPDSPHFSTAEDSPELAAWTEVEEARYMPRRIRGSYRGRALG